MSPYFQRNLVWRTIHKVDFIKTILMGYPFPQIFIAKGAIDIENMTNTSCIVDGQQRMNSIKEFINGEFKVEGKYYLELSDKEKEDLLKYQIPIIDLDIKNDDPEVIEIFKRLNRTFYSLSQIEKLSTEFAPSEFMLVAKFLLNNLKAQLTDDEEVNPFQYDPNIPVSFIDWVKLQKASHYSKLIMEEGIFSAYELTRQVQLMFTLNLMSTIIGDFFNRNDLTTFYLDEYSNEFPQKQEIINRVEFAAQKMLKLKLKRKSYWLNKTNSFSLMCLFARKNNVLEKIDEKQIKNRLENFEANLPDDYRLAAKEGVNNKKERLIRNTHLEKVLFDNNPLILPVLLNMK